MTSLEKNDSSRFYQNDKILDQIDQLLQQGRKEAMKLQNEGKESFARAIESIMNHVWRVRQKTINFHCNSCLSCEIYCSYVGKIVEALKCQLEAKIHQIYQHSPVDCSKINY